jgi:hypothetical protein
MMSEIHPQISDSEVRNMQRSSDAAFFAKHSVFTWRPRFCRWPARGWSIWWLWFEFAWIGGDA